MVISLAQSTKKNSAVRWLLEPFQCTATGNAHLCSCSTHHLLLLPTCTTRTSSTAQTLTPAQAWLPPHFFLIACLLNSRIQRISLNHNAPALSPTNAVSFTCCSPCPTRGLNLLKPPTANNIALVTHPPTHPHLFLFSTWSTRTSTGSKLRTLRMRLLMNSSGASQSNRAPTTCAVKAVRRVRHRWRTLLHIVPTVPPCCFYNSLRCGAYDTFCYSTT